MSTPDELVLPAAQVPLPSSVPSVGAPSPGLALAEARVPGGPSVPDGDPMALTALIGTLANQLFAAPELPVLGPAAAVPVTPTPSALALPVTPSAPTAIGPTHAEPSMVPPVTSAPSVPSAPLPGLSPFTSPLSFDSLGDLDALAMTPSTLPLLDAPTAPGVPATTTAPPATPREPTPRFETLGFQVDPVARPAPADGPLDPLMVRSQFPILSEVVNGKPLVWLDNAATTQKPRAVIDRLTYFYEHENSNIHRAAHTLAGRATDAYEGARASVRRFINAPSAADIVFVRGATEGINLVAQAWGRANLTAGDEVVVSWLEHHANIVPWQQVCAATGARLRVAPVDDRGQVLLDEYARLLGPRTKLVAFTQVSNALGTITPAHAMIAMAHAVGARVLLDGAQAVSHLRVDVTALDCDFYVFSGHKVFAPTGIGAVYGKREVLAAMPPWQGGGNMIADVTFERTTFQGPPARFEAGTGNIADAVGLGAALDWLTQVGIDRVSAYEHALTEYATERLHEVPGLTLIGTAPEKAGVLSFVLAGQRTEDVSKLLDRDGIAVRSGHHCAQPILRRFGLEATVRASLAPYNTTGDLDALVDALHRLQAGRA